MRIFVDLDTQKLIASPGLVQEITALNFKRSPYANVEVQFTRNGTVIELPEPATGIWGIKTQGKYDDDYVTAALSWVKTGSGETTVYTFIFTFITAPLNTLFFVDGDSANDVPSLTLMGELQWTTGGSTLKTPTIQIVVANDVNRGGETVPALPPVAYGVFLPSIIGLTGGDVQGIQAAPAITAAGTGYAVNDILTLSGGTFVQSAQLKVATIGGGGAITSVSINRAGQYSVTPASPVAVTGGGGTGATFTPTWVVVSPIYLDAIPTAGTILTGTIVEILIVVGGVREWLTYVLVAGVAAGAGVVTPDDYDGVTNDRRWVGAVGPSGPAGVDAGIPYKWNTSTAATDPGAGKVKVNNASLSLATALYISETDDDTNSLAALLATWDDGTSTIRGRILFRSPTAPANFVLYDITGAVVDNGAWDTFTVAAVASGGTLTNNMPVRAFFVPKGDAGYAFRASGTVAAGAAANVDFTDHDTFKERSLAANTTLTVLGLVDGQAGVVPVANPASWTLTWVGVDEWKGTGGVAPSAPATGVTDLYTFVRCDTKIYGTVATG